MKTPTRSIAVCLVLGLHFHGQFCHAQPVPSGAAIRETIRAATDYFSANHSVHGGYVYHYTVDTQQRWGEGLAKLTEIWVQPPGTPTVGLALLRAYHATGDKHYLGLAQRAAEALAHGQLRSGGWTASIDCKEFGRWQFSGGKRRRDGTTSLDDGQTQTAIQFMVMADEALDFQHEAIHESAVLALDSLLAAQFPNGAFPQGWKDPHRTGPVENNNPTRKANYPTGEWRTEGKIKNYWDMATLNDNVCGYVVDALITAHRVYGDERYLAAAKRVGDFLLLAQMPEPQPAWAQQYNDAMQPIWARRFEPPGISGDESQEVLETLMKVAVTTGDVHYLKPVEGALTYLRRSLLPDGQLARYYELKTNRPLYMTRQGREYTLTYDDSRLPKHYGWKIPARIDQLQQRYDQIKSGNFISDMDKSGQPAVAARAIDRLDDEGRWLSTHDGSRLVGQPKFQIGQRYVSSAVFSQNITALADTLIARQAE